jgi:hypothetical protein
VYRERNRGFIHKIKVPGHGQWIILTDDFFEPLREIDTIRLQEATAALMDESGDVVEAAQEHAQIVSNQLSKRLKGHVPPAVSCVGGVFAWVASWSSIALCSTGLGCGATVALMTFTSVSMADSCAEAIEDLRKPRTPVLPGRGGGGSGHGDRPPYDNHPDEEVADSPPFGWGGSGSGCAHTEFQCGAYYWVSTGPNPGDGYWTQDCEVICVNN